MSRRGTGWTSSWEWPDGAEWLARVVLALVVLGAAVGMALRALRPGAVLPRPKLAPALARLKSTPL